MDEFEAFKKWAIANGYSDDLTLDRKDNGVGYCPSNCRFISIADQQKNKTNNRYVKYNGQERRICELADEAGIPRPVFYGRMRRGWTLERALETPVGGSK